MRSAHVDLTSTASQQNWIKDKENLVSIGGPALAYWLHRYGFRITIVEKAPEVRRGGQAVDFKGPIHHAVLRKMGILGAVKQATIPNGDGYLVNASGRKVGIIPGAFAGGEINVPRGDLTKILASLTDTVCEYIFDDSIASLTETENDILVTFVRGGSRSFDIVVGADGIHSTVRSLEFGPESSYVKHLGYYYVLANLDAGDDDLMYNEPGLMAAVSGAKAPAFFVFASEPLPSTRDSVEARKAQVMDAYRNCGWRVLELMAQLPAAKEFYMDSISRVTMDTYSKGRIVLVGDSAYGNALGGFGTGLALVGAYVLAGELLRAGGDYAAAFYQYEKKIRDYASVSQTVNAGRFMAPATRLGIFMRNALFTALYVCGPLMKVVDRPATNIKLEDYESSSPPNLRP